ncbi:hypothetical protein H0H93_012809 [Arthromyces matolae]|nr:hypothetical protein H0H93_012809 [Arthromyces matolae]
MLLPIVGNKQTAKTSQKRISSPDQASGETSQKRPRITGIREHDIYQDVSTMIDDMLRAGVKEDGKIMPWRDEDREWSDGMVRAVVAQIFRRRDHFVAIGGILHADSLTENNWEHNVNNMKRSELNKQLDDLWAWVVERRTIDNDNRSEGLRAQAQKDLERYRINPQIKSADDLARLLIRSLPKSSNNIAEMPWHHQTTPTSPSWPDFWIKPVLAYIWKQKMTVKAKSNLPSPDEREEILKAEPNPESEKRLEEAMDVAWKLYVEYRRNRNGFEAERFRENAADRWKLMEKKCKTKYVDFKY